MRGTFLLLLIGCCSHSGQIVPYKHGLKFGYRDQFGRSVIEPRFVWADEFHEGLARVIVGDFPDWTFGFINRSGEFVIQPDFDWVGSWQDRTALVLKGGAYYRIDRMGAKRVISPEYDDIISRWYLGMAKVTVRGVQYIWWEGQWKAEWEVWRVK